MEELANALSCLQSKTEAEEFLTAFLSPIELKHLGKRWLVFIELTKTGDQQSIKETLSVSTGTITRANNQLKNARQSRIIHDLISRKS